MTAAAAPMIWIDSGALREPQEETGEIISIRLFGRTTTHLQVCEPGRTPVYITPAWVRAEPSAAPAQDAAAPVTPKTKRKKS